MGQPHFTEEEEAHPVRLSYGRQAPAWRRRKTIISTVLALGVLAGAYFSWTPVNNFFERRAYRREAQRWYTAALTWSEPPTKLKYTENPADAPNGKFDRSYGRSGATTYTGYRAFGSGFVERLPLFTGDGMPILSGTPDQVMLFMHQRTTREGLSRLISVSNPRFDGNLLRMQIDQIGPLKGEYRILRGGGCELDMTGICGPGEIRLFAAQPDPTDAAKFSIPFEARDVKGFIDGEFVPGAWSSTDLALQKIEKEANSQVKLTIRMNATTQPATTRASS
jgi:hypothetical protein